MKEIVDWHRFLYAQSTTLLGQPDRKALAIDTHIRAPVTSNETPPWQALPLATGQSIHAYLNKQGYVLTKPQKNLSEWVLRNSHLRRHLQDEVSDLNRHTPLMLYILAEAEHEPGDSLGPVGSWLVATTVLGCYLDDPESALNCRFDPAQSPLRTRADKPIAELESWMDFAGLLQS